MCSNWAPLDLVKHVVLTEFLVKILWQRAVICHECFLFYCKLSNGTEETQYTSILILLVYKQNIFLSPWSVLTLLLSPVHNFFVYSFILTKFWRPTTQDSNWAEVLFERSVLYIRFIRLKKPHLFRIFAS